MIDSERDYILASEVTRFRIAIDILRHVAPGNVAAAVGYDESRAEAEIRHAVSCLHVWASRLEWAIEVAAHGADANDDEPWLRDWPKECP